MPMTASSSNIQARYRETLLSANARHYTTYAILDAAQHGDIYRRVTSFKQWQCLYRGEIPIDLAKVAPYIVQLEADCPHTDWLLSHCNKSNWGIFTKSASNIEAISQHFRSFLKVFDPAGAPLYFRFYDPRVFRTYLPSCTEKELLLWFRQIHTFYVDSEDGTALRSFTLHGQSGLQQQSIELQPAPPPAVLDADLTIPIGTVVNQGIDVAELDADKTMTLTPADIAKLRALSQGQH